MQNEQNNIFLLDKEGNIVTSLTYLIHMTERASAAEILTLRGDPNYSIELGKILELLEIIMNEKELPYSFGIVDEKILAISLELGFFKSCHLPLEYSRDLKIETDS